MARRTKEQALETRKRILEAAARIFGQHGFNDVSLENIASAAGVTRGAVYWHFRSKAELFNTVCENTPLPFEILKTDSNWNQESNPLLQFRDVLLTSIRTISSSSFATKFFFEPSCKAELVNPGVQLLERHCISAGCSKFFFKEVLNEAVEKKYLPQHLDIELACRALYGLLGGLLSEWLLDPGSFDLECQTDRSLQAAIFAMRFAPSMWNTDAGLLLQ